MNDFSDANSYRFIDNLIYIFHGITALGIAAVFYKQYMRQTLLNCQERCCQGQYTKEVDELMTAVQPIAGGPYTMALDAALHQEDEYSYAGGGEALLGGTGVVDPDYARRPQRPPQPPSTSPSPSLSSSLQPASSVTSAGSSLPNSVSWVVQNVKSTAPTSDAALPAEDADSNAL